MDLAELYQDIILDHSRNPRHHGPVPESERAVEHENPTCGDTIRLALATSGDHITDVRFEGHGCAISMASASMMTEAVSGKPVAAARALAARFAAYMRGEVEWADDEMGELAALRGVRQYPLRVKCATLAWHALEKALGPPADGQDRA